MFDVNVQVRLAGMLAPEARSVQEPTSLAQPCCLLLRGGAAAGYFAWVGFGRLDIH
jgi:hypothetical protein